SPRRHAAPPDRPAVGGAERQLVLGAVVRHRHAGARRAMDPLGDRHAARRRSDRACQWRRPWPPVRVRCVSGVFRYTLQRVPKPAREDGPAASTHAALRDPHAAFRRRPPRDRPRRRRRRPTPCGGGADPGGDRATRRKGGRTMTAWQRAHGRAAVWFLLPALGLLALFVLWPLARAAWWSVTNADLLNVGE